MKIVQRNHFNHYLDNAHSSSYHHRPCEVKMSILKMALVLFISVGGAYYYGYIEGQIKARAEIFGENVKRVDRKHRRY